ncbi:MAG: OadG family protein [Nitrincola lacisaponensis]|uniref:Probable oxaloacetate decarboxylase gamma chain n=1 Tax=Nitrincola lacisaponensis TaxID=267850 RepID=A0A063Y805_9GAMM|nr:OadG family protein [Nitrincola lacisaponensis]KDE40512.1 Oxaloacetate decarboxylase gamma chain [Nitrincola lacisaponensis]
MDDLLAEGLSLMVFGMGFVVVFLTLLVIATSLMSRLVMRFEPAPVPVTAAKKGSAPAAPSGQPDDQVLIAVMTAALKKFRADRNDQ